MSDRDRQRLRRTIDEHEWARSEYERIKRLARNGDGYWAAFLYALDGDVSLLDASRSWLMDYGQAGGDLGPRAKSVADDYFEGGHPWLGDLYAYMDDKPLLAYDWVYNALNSNERRIIERGIRTSAVFRIRAMDRWLQTPNLVFTPTYMVAMAGLTTDIEAFLDWGLLRKPGSPQGGYFSVVESMIGKGGVWGEAPIYPVYGKTLLKLTRMSRFLASKTGAPWFERSHTIDDSPRALMDYFIATAYPIEQTGHGRGQIRIATYGDGSTNATGDLFLVNPAEPGMHLHEELAGAYALTGEPRYAAFLKLVPDYRPDLWDHPPLPRVARLPPAASRVWTDFGVAMLRSDESPRYWTNPQAIAVFQIMGRGYGHDHRDKFSIMLHGAGRLLYPDYNAVQYENPSIGWTRNTIAHNTVLVDEQDTRNVGTDFISVRHMFTPEVKFLATTGRGVFPGVTQTRALFLTSGYLLDYFHVHSTTPHDYDYLLHSFGRPQPVHPVVYRPTQAFAQRYWLMRDAVTAQTSKAWSFDFILDEVTQRNRERFKARQHKKQASVSRLGEEWFAHEAAVRMHSAATPNTQIAYGTGVHDLPMLIVRRAEVRDTVFTMLHEPYATHQVPKVRDVSVVAQSRRALVARVRGQDYIDYAAVTWDASTAVPVVALAGDQDRHSKFVFRGHGYLRIAADGEVSSQGDWVGFRVPLPEQSTKNRDNPPTGTRGYFTFGSLAAPPEPRPTRSGEIEIPTTLSPEVVRLALRDKRTLGVAIRNPLHHPIEGWLEIEDRAGFNMAPKRAAFGPLSVGEQQFLGFTVRSTGAEPGRYTLNYRIAFRNPADARFHYTGAYPLEVTVGAVLSSVYRYPEPAVYRVHAPRYIAELDMFHGLVRSFRDNTGQERLNKGPLFTFSEGSQMLLSDDTPNAFTWPVESPAMLTAEATHRARWHAVFEADRIHFSIDPTYTQSKRIQFSIPGRWRTVGTSPRWRSIIAADGALHDATRRIPLGSTLRAGELDFADNGWNLCVAFEPPQPVELTETGMRFSLSSQLGEHWSLGSCQSGELRSWLSD